ncbi:hypothetical protein Tco_1455805 [Tanacetum coccineum]
MNDSILNNNEWKKSDYGNPLNTATSSFFKAHDEHDIEDGNELRQMKHKEDNKDDEQPNKRICKAEKFEAIKYSLGPNEEYIAIRRCEYNTWERNEDIIMEYLVKISKKARILELKRRHLKITVLTSNTPHPSRKIRRICSCTSLKTTNVTPPNGVPSDLVSGGVTSLNISSTKHKERPLREIQLHIKRHLRCIKLMTLKLILKDSMYTAIRLALQVSDQRPPN